MDSEILWDILKVFQKPFFVKLVAACNKLKHHLQRSSRDQCIILYLFAVCPPGKYGDNCTETCGECIHGDCNVITGQCMCDSGYHGQSCSQGKFGINGLKFKRGKNTLKLGFS